MKMQRRPAPACRTRSLIRARALSTDLPTRAAQRGADSTRQWIIEAVCGTDPRSPDFLAHFASQLMLIVRLIGLDTRPE